MKRELAMGINPVSSLVECAPDRIIRAWMSKGNPRLEPIIEQLAALGVPIETADARALDRRADGVRHQGLIVEFQAREALSESGLMDLLDQHPGPLLLVLDGVTDPNNLGACLRSAAAAGALAVVVPRDRSASLTPAARRAAAGAAELIPLVSVTNLARTLRQLGERGLWRVGLAAEAQGSLYQADLVGPLALVLGSEGRGLRRLTREHCDQLVRIPMPGPIESLNVSVAASICLFEAVRVRQSA